MAPADDLATVGVTWTARWRGTRTPCTPAPSQLRMIAPRLPGSVTPSMATRKGALPGRPLISSSRSASGSGAANAMTPCGASLRARASSLVRATWAIGTRALLARATMSATPSSGVPSWAISSVEIQISWTATSPGEQQLARRLTALDLVAAETLGATGRMRIGLVTTPTDRSGATGATRRQRQVAGEHGTATRRGAGAGLLGRLGRGTTTALATTRGRATRCRTAGARSRRRWTSGGRATAAGAAGARPTATSAARLAGAGRTTGTTRPPGATGATARSTAARTAAATRAAPPDGRRPELTTGPSSARPRRSRRCPRRDRAPRGPRAGGP